jgi:protein-disulfide isomerase
MNRLTSARRLALALLAVCAQVSCAPSEGTSKGDPLHYRVVKNVDRYVTVLSGSIGTTVFNNSTMNLAFVSLRCDGGDDEFEVNVQPGDKKDFPEYRTDGHCKTTSALFDYERDAPVLMSPRVGLEGPSALGRQIEIDLTNYSSRNVTLGSPKLTCSYSMRREGRWKRESAGTLTTTAPIGLPPKTTKRFVLKSIETGTTGLFPGGLGTWTPDPEGEAKLVSSLRCRWLYDEAVGPSRKPELLKEVRSIPVSAALPTAATPPGVASRAATAPLRLVASKDSSGDYFVGNPAARVVMVEYFSPTSAWTAQWRDGDFRKLYETYVATGMVKYVFREFMTSPPEAAAASFLLARCAGDENYMSVLGDVMASRLEMAEGPGLHAVLVRIAANHGLNKSQFDACMTNESELNNFNQRAEAASEAGVEGVPTLLLNGQIIDRNVGLFPKIDAALASQ